MKTFEQWLTERGKRTAMGIYPPLYGAGQTPPLYKASYSPSHLYSYANIHGGWEGQYELLSEPIKKAYKKNKKKGKTIKLLKKNPWAKSFSYVS